jgi:hypothetical protein
MPSLAASSYYVVRAIYSYEVQGPDELSLKEGETVELTSGPSGEQACGDGWWEGESLFLLPARTPDHSFQMFVTLIRQDWIQRGGRGYLCAYFRFMVPSARPQSHSTSCMWRSFDTFCFRLIDVGAEINVCCRVK